MPMQMSSATRVQVQLACTACAKLQPAGALLTIFGTCKGQTCRGMRHGVVKFLMMFRFNAGGALPPGAGGGEAAAAPAPAGGAAAVPIAPRGGILRELHALVVGFLTSLLPG